MPNALRPGVRRGKLALTAPFAISTDLGVPDVRNRAGALVSFRPGWMPAVDVIA
jgi:hypothetical protein